MSKLKSITSFVDLKGSIAHVDIKGQVTHVNLQLTDLYLNPDTIDRIFTDSLSMLEALVYSISKDIRPEVVFVNEDHAISFSKALSDSVGVTESIDILRIFGRELTDTATMSDTPVVSFSGAHSDAVSATEILTYAMDKALSDTATMSDSPALEPSLAKSDSVSMSQVFSRVVTFVRSFSDTISLDDRTSLADPLATDVETDKTNVMSISDVLTYDWAKARTDTFSMVESHAIDFTPGGFTDSFSFTDSETINTSLGKSDSFGFTDSEALATSLGKSDILSFTDSPALSNSLASSDSLSFADAETLAVAMAKSESLNITETHAYSFGKSAQDSATISESISILNANRQSVLNASTLNSNTLN
jgi:hypothetical protein